MLLGVTLRLGAQPAIRAEDVRVGSDEERYLRALSLLMPDDAPGWTIRPSFERRQLAAFLAVGGPWTIDTAVRGATIRGGELTLALHSGRPGVWADGPAWTGRGLSATVSPVAVHDSDRLHVRVAPVLWWADDRRFPLVPTAGAFPWSDAATPGTIDLPQRLGTGAVARLDPGESRIEARWRTLRVALASDASRIGPAADHAVVLQGDHGGIPRAELGVPHALATPIGRFRLQVAYGRAPQSAWAPARRTGAHHTSWTVGSWRPRHSSNIELGVVRVVHRDWRGLRARDLLAPFGSIYDSQWFAADTFPDNHLASLFARWRVPAAGLELYGEYGRNDRSRNWRDLFTELEHNAAWLFGVQRAWRGADASLWALNATAVGGRISPIDPFRGQDFFYEHSRLVQGHTLRGQSLGTPLLQRSGGGELRVDRYDSAGRRSLLLRTRGLPNTKAVDVPMDLRRQEWTAAVEWMRWTSTGAWRVRVGATADLGYAPDRDLYDVHVAFGLTRRR